MSGSDKPQKHHKCVGESFSLSAFSHEAGALLFEESNQSYGAVKTAC